MSETIIETLTAPETATPEQLRQRAVWAKRQQDKRARDRAAKEESLYEKLSPEERVAKANETWDENWNKLSQEEKVEINDHVKWLDDLKVLMSEGSQLCQRYDLNGNDLAYIKLIFRDALETAEKYPPTEDEFYIEFKVLGVNRREGFPRMDFTQLHRQPKLLKKFGIAADHIDGHSLKAFLSAFTGFYLRYRNARIEEEYAEGIQPISWDDIEKTLSRAAKFSKYEKKP